MRRQFPLRLLLASLSLQAKDKPAYEKGELLQMDSASCGFAEKDGKTLAGQIFGTDGQHKKTQERFAKSMCCGRSGLPTESGRKMTSTGASSDRRDCRIRIHKDKLLLRVPESDGKEREYIVLSMTPRTDVAENRPGAAHANR